MRLDSSPVVVNALACAGISAYFGNINLEGTMRTAKLGTLSVLAAVNIFMQGWWWSHQLSEKTQHLPILIIILQDISNIITFYPPTTQRVLLVSLNICLLLVWGFSALHVDPKLIDLRGRFKHSPTAEYNDKNLHWTISLRFFMLSLFYIARRSSLCNAVLTRDQRPAFLSLSNDVPKLFARPKLAQLSMSELMWVSSCVAAMAVFCVAAAGW